MPVLNTYAAAFQPDRADRAVLTLNALLGLGTALAPVFVAVFVGLGFWWGLPVLSTVLLVLLLLAPARLPLRAETPPPSESPAERGGIPSRFWLFAGFAVLYGICETMNGNWSEHEMTSRSAPRPPRRRWPSRRSGPWSPWAACCSPPIGRWMPPRTVFRLLPVVLVGTFTLTAALSDAARRGASSVFGLAGLGCSALLPLAISLGQGALPRMSAAVAGGVIAFYQVGYGIAAFGVGPLVDHGAPLSTLYGWTARPQPPWPCCPSPSWRVTVPRHGCIPARRRPTAQRLPPASTGTSGSRAHSSAQGGPPTPRTGLSR